MVDAAGTNLTQSDMDAYLLVKMRLEEHANKSQILWTQASTHAEETAQLREEEYRLHRRRVQHDNEGKLLSLQRAALYLEWERLDEQLLNHQAKLRSRLAALDGTAETKPTTHISSKKRSRDKSVARKALPRKRSRIPALQVIPSRVTCTRN